MQSPGPTAYHKHRGDFEIVCAIVLIGFGTLTMTVVTIGRAIVRVLRGVRAEVRFQRTGEVELVETPWQAFKRRAGWPGRGE